MPGGVVSLFAPLKEHDQVGTIITDQANDEIIAAPGTGRQIFITGVFVTNADATVGTVVNFKKDTTTSFGHYAHQNGGGFGFNYLAPIPWGENVALNVANASDNSNTNIQVTFFIGGV